MDNYKISIRRFNEFAQEYAERFMSVESYKDSLDEFCNISYNSVPKILELACGPGNVTRYLRSRFPDSKILAIDLAPKMIEIARQNVSGVSFKVMDVRKIYTLKEKYNLIMCSFCLPFLSKSDTTKLITDCSKILTKNGRLYISTMEGDEKDAGFEETSFSGSSKIYFNYHAQNHIEKMLINGGFRISYFKRQDYEEFDGRTLVDMIFIGIKI